MKYNTFNNIYNAKIGEKNTSVARHHFIDRKATKYQKVLDIQGIERELMKDIKKRQEKYYDHIKRHTTLIFFLMFYETKKKIKRHKTPIIFKKMFL